MWGAIGLVAALFMAFIIVPPMMNLNSLKPKLEAAITRQTGVAAEIRGDVHFSLLYRATIVAHDIKIPTGTVRSAMFTIPLHDIFDMQAAALDAQIAVSGARIKVAELTPVNFKHKLEITDSTINFLNKDYDIVRGTFDGGRFNGTVRTNQHKYDIEFENDEFHVKNKNNNLEINGQLYSDGTARGELAIITDNINRWFDFNEPRIDRRIDMTMNFDWDGEYGFDFTNIRGNGFTGAIKLWPDGRRDIKLNAADFDYDFSFLLHPMQMFKNTTFDLDFRGDLRVAGMRFSHLKLNAVGTENRIQIGGVIADNMAMTGGYIDADGAHNVLITLPIDDVAASCVFSGTPTDWKCEKFTWGAISGKIAVQNDVFNIVISSSNNMPSTDALSANARRLGSRGHIEFTFADAAGEIRMDKDDIIPSFRFARDKNFAWSGINLPFLPDAMRNARGDFSRADKTTTFRPVGGAWQIVINDNGEFMIAGDDFRTWLPDLDLAVLRPLPYAIAGKYANGMISDLRAEVANQSFTGRIVDGTVSLNTDLLNLDAIVSQDYIDRFAELEFTGTHPLALPFAIDTNVSINAKKLIYNGDEYANFVYSLKPGTQTLSITDAMRGNVLATIARRATTYDIFIQLNGFAIDGPVLARDMPLNVADTRITAEISLRTSGQIAHDLIYNLTGVMDITFDGGYIMGLGLDNFYASAENINRLNAEYALSAAFDGGITRLKKMTIVGKYANGVFDTTSPLTLSMPHADAVGQIQITDDALAARLRLVMRGTSPDPQPIDLEVLGNGTRNYSFTQIMRDFDAGYLRNFVQTHARF